MLPYDAFQFLLRSRSQWSFHFDEFFLSCAAKCMILRIYTKELCEVYNCSLQSYNFQNFLCNFFGTETLCQVFFWHPVHVKFGRYLSCSVSMRFSIRTWNVLGHALISSACKNSTWEIKWRKIKNSQRHSCIQRKYSEIILCARRSVHTESNWEGQKALKKR